MKSWVNAPSLFILFISPSLFIYFYLFISFFFTSILLSSVYPWSVCLLTSEYFGHTIKPEAPEHGATEHGTLEGQWNTPE